MQFRCNSDLVCLWLTHSDKCYQDTYMCMYMLHVHVLVSTSTCTSTCTCVHVHVHVHVVHVMHMCMYQILRSTT